MQIGIIGFSQAGKTTLVNALTGSYRPVGPQNSTGSGRVEFNSTTISVPDHRVDWLCNLYRSQKKTYAQITWTDISGVRGSMSRFSGDLLDLLGRMDVLCHVVRGFDSNTVPHPMITVDPRRDIAALNDELILNDMLSVERKLDQLKIEWEKGGGRDRSVIEREQHLFARMLAVLEDSRPIRQMELTSGENRLLSGHYLLTRKPIIIVINVGGNAASLDEIIAGDYGRHTPEWFIALRGRLEMEISQLDPDDAELFLKEYGLDQACRYRMSELALDALDMHRFFTVVREEVRAWTVPVGSTALEAAGRIHSDMRSGFIKTEVTAFEDLQHCGSEDAAKAAGKWRLEGKDYLVQDGDIMCIRFSPPANVKK